MATEPSIKGAMIGRLIDDAKSLVASSAWDREQIEAQLSPETLELFDGKVEMSSWYPIQQYVEMTNLLWQEEGGGRVEYLHQRGANVIQKLMETNLYQQLEYLDRNGGSVKGVTRDQILHTCRMVGSITRMVRNFGEDSWDWDPERPNHMLHHVHDAAAMPEAMRIVGEGAETYLVRLSRPDAPPVTSERVTPSHIIYTSDYSGVFEGDA